MGAASAGLLGLLGSVRLLDWDRGASKHTVHRATLAHLPLQRARSLVTALLPLTVSELVSYTGTCRSQGSGYAAGQPSGSCGAAFTASEFVSYMGTCGERSRGRRAIALCAATPRLLLHPLPGLVQPMAARRRQFGHDRPTQRAETVQVHVCAEPA